MANLMLALPEILVVLRGPDPHSCLLCLQGAERKIRDEERKQSKRKGKCVGPIPRECLAAAVSCSPSLDPAACGLDWGESDMASTSTKAFPSSCGGGQALTHRTAGHVLGGLRLFWMLGLAHCVDQAGLQVIEMEQPLHPECWD